MNSIMGKVKDMNKSDPSPSSSYSAFFDIPSENDLPEVNKENKNEGFIPRQQQTRKKVGSTSVFTLKSVKETFDTVKQVHQNIASGIKQKLKFTVSQLTNKLNKKSTYESLEQGTNSSAFTTPAKNNVFGMLDNPCYQTPTMDGKESNDFTPRRSQRKKRKLQMTEEEESYEEENDRKDPVRQTLRDLKKTRQSMRKVIKKQDKRQAITSKRQTPTKRHQTPAVGSPAKMARYGGGGEAEAATPMRVRQLRRSTRLSNTPQRIIDHRNKMRVVRRRSSRIVGLISGITNPIAYQLNTKI